MSSIKVESQFQTREISFVAFMELNDMKPVDYTIVQRGNRKMATFRFNKNEVFMKLKSKYFEGDALVEPMSFMDAIRRIKTKINNMDG